MDRDENLAIELVVLRPPASRRTFFDTRAVVVAIASSQFLGKTASQLASHRSIPPECLVRNGSVIEKCISCRDSFHPMHQIHITRRGEWSALCRDNEKTLWRYSSNRKEDKENKKLSLFCTTNNRPSGSLICNLLPIISLFRRESFYLPC